MIGELERARIKGLTFTEFQGDIVRLVRSFIEKSYVYYPMLNQYGINKEDIEVEVYNKLYNRKDDKSLSNIESYFIKASSMKVEGELYGPDTKYIVCLIKRVVSNTISQLCRTILRKKGMKPSISLDIILTGEEPIMNRLLGSEDTYEDLSYKDALNQVKLREYPYVVVLDSKTEKLTSRSLLNLLVDGYTYKELITMIYSIEDNEPITPSKFLMIKREIIKNARHDLRNYL